MSYRLHLSKENFKFSGTHFTIFSADQSERLHGHNYYVTVEMDLKDTDAKLGMAVDFNVIKTKVRELCAYLDEYVLIPSKSPYLQMKVEGESLRVSLGKKSYTFPRSDVRELPLVNITSEELARWLAEELGPKIRDAVRFESLRVQIDESRGQGASYIL